MQADLSLEAYDYRLPPELIAQHPLDRRDGSRLLRLDRRSGGIEHLSFADILRDFRSGDIVVLNDTRVFKARLQARKETGGKAELFLLEYPQPVVDDTGDTAHRYRCEVLVKSSRKPQPGSTLLLDDSCSCRLLRYRDRGHWQAELVLEKDDLETVLERNGEVPLPPYINRPEGALAGDSERYQTVYADQPGAVAAPTAGLHFTAELLEKLRESGVRPAFLTLHVGYGTFAPVETTDIREHRIHREQVSLSADNAALINQAKQDGGRIWAIGTTSVRGLEQIADEHGRLRSYSGWCDCYIFPGYTFRVVDNLITNFHLPRSSLMFLVAALCGREKLIECYQLAIDHGYRFYSYGDAMAIIS